MMRSRQITIAHLIEREPYMTLDDIQKLIRAERYTWSEKVQSLLEDGWYELEDLAESILGAPGIYKTERDELGEAVGGYKYVILGRDTHGRPFYTCGKVVPGSDGNYYFYITAHEDKFNG